MSGTATAAIAAAVVVVLVLVVAAEGLLGVRTSGVVSEGPVAAEGPGMPVPDGTSALVFGSHQTGSGFSLLGLRFTQPKHAATIWFVPPPGCEPSAGEELVPEGPCEGIPAWGEVSGDGVNIDGQDLAMVSVPISQGCFDVLKEGDLWPPEHPECASDRQ